MAPQPRSCGNRARPLAHSPQRGLRFFPDFALRDLLLWLVCLILLASLAVFLLCLAGQASKGSSYWLFALVGLAGLVKFGWDTRKLGLEWIRRLPRASHLKCLTALVT